MDESFYIEAMQAGRRTFGNGPTEEHTAEQWSWEPMNRQPYWSEVNGGNHSMASNHLGNGSIFIQTPMPRYQFDYTEAADFGAPYEQQYHLSPEENVRQLASPQRTYVHSSSAPGPPDGQTRYSASDNSRTNFNSVTSRPSSLPDTYMSDEAQQSDGEDTNMDSTRTEVSKMLPLQQIRYMHQQSKSMHGEPGRLYAVAAKLKFYSSFGVRAWAHMEEYDRDELLNEAEELTEMLQDTLADVANSTRESLNDLMSIAIERLQADESAAEPDDAMLGTIEETRTRLEDDAFQGILQRTRRQTHIFTNIDRLLNAAIPCQRKVEVGILAVTVYPDLEITTSSAWLTSCMYEHREYLESTRYFDAARGLDDTEGDALPSLPGVDAYVQTVNDEKSARQVLELTHFGKFHIKSHQYARDDVEEVEARMAHYKDCLFRAFVSGVADPSEEQEYQWDEFRRKSAKFDFALVEAHCWELVKEVIRFHRKGCLLQKGTKPCTCDRNMDDKHLTCAQRLKLIIKYVRSDKLFALDMVKPHSDGKIKMVAGPNHHVNTKRTYRKSNKTRSNATAKARAIQKAHAIGDNEARYGSDGDGDEETNGALM